MVLFVQLGGGYLFGLPIGIVADSVGATIGAVAAFLLGRTVSFALIYICESKKVKTSPLVSVGYTLIEVSLN